MQASLEFPLSILSSHSPHAPVSASPLVPRLAALPPISRFLSLPSASPRCAASPPRRCDFPSLPPRDLHVDGNLFRRKECCKKPHNRINLSPKRCKSLRNCSTGGGAIQRTASQSADVAESSNRAKSTGKTPAALPCAPVIASDNESCI